MLRLSCSRQRRPRRNPRVIFRIIQFHFHVFPPFRCIVCGGATATSLATHSLLAWRRRQPLSLLQCAWLLCLLLQPAHAIDPSGPSPLSAPATGRPASCLTSSVIIFFLASPEISSAAAMCSRWDLQTNHFLSPLHRLAGL